MAEAIRKLQKRSVILLLSLWSVVFAIVPTLGGAPLRALRTLAGPKGYWLIGVLVSVALFAAGGGVLAISLACLFVAIGMYCELEEMELSEGWSGFWALSIGAVVCAAGFAFWIALHGNGWYQTLIELMELPIAKVKELNPNTVLSPEDLLYQMPSLVIIVSIFALYLALIFEKPILKKFRQPTKTRRSLKTFRVADVFLWIFLVAALGGFVDHGYKNVTLVSTNVLNVLFVVYFLQGLAVTAVGFKKLKLGMFWQFLAYFVLTTQLPFVLFFWGLVDFWFDFRSRWTKQPQNQLKSEIFRK